MPIFGPPNVEKMKAKGDVKGLIRILASPYNAHDATLKTQAIKALGQLRAESSVSELKAICLKAYSDSIRHEAVLALSQIRNNAAMLALKEIASELKEPSTRRDALRALAEIGDEQAVSMLLDLYATWKTSGNVQKQGEVREALLQVKGHSGIDSLVAAIDDSEIQSNVPTVTEVVSYLNGLMELLDGKKLGDQSESMVASALAFLNTKFNFESEIVASLTNTFEHPSEEVRSRAVIILAGIHSEKTIEPLLAALQPTSASLQPRATIAAIEALGQYNDRRPVETLITMLRTNHYIIRGTAAESLGNIGDQRALEPLTVALQDKDNMVARNAADALAKLGGIQDMGVMLEIYVKRRDFDSLVKLGTRAINPLIEFLKGSAEDNRRKAAKALGQIGDKTAIKPLLQMIDELKNDNRVNDLQSALLLLLMSIATELEVDDLRLLATLGDFKYVEEVKDDATGDYWPLERVVDCEKIRLLANQELVRRGLAD